MTPSGTSRLRTALFDLRTIIGGLFTVYGLVCLIYGVIDFTAADAKRAGGINVNLYGGIGMLIFGASFIAWAIWRPLAPDQTEKTNDDA